MAGYAGSIHPLSVIGRFPTSSGELAQLEARIGEVFADVRRALG